jgi:hypothetical protein
MDTAGKAVLFSGVTVLISLSAVMLVPSPAFRSMALGIMLAVAFVLAATLTLLPAVLGTLGHRVDALALPWVHAGEHRSPRFERWAQRLWRRPVVYGAASHTYRHPATKTRHTSCKAGRRSVRFVAAPFHERQENWGKTLDARCNCLRCGAAQIRRRRGWLGH